MQTQRNCAFRGETEPKSLKWDNVSWETEDDLNIVLFSEKHVHHSNLERKNGQMAMRKPRREKNEHKIKVHRNNDDVRCLHIMMRAHREFCSPHQTHVFCQP